jgi:hypothetical protein
VYSCPIISIFIYGIQGLYLHSSLTSLCMAYIVFIIFLLITSADAHDGADNHPINFSLTNNTTPFSHSTTVNPSRNFKSSALEKAFVLEDSLQRLYTTIGLEKYDLPFKVFRYGMIGYLTLQQQGKLSNKQLLSIIDFTKSSKKKRFYTIDLQDQQVKYYTYVSHGKNTGEDMAKSFSNRIHSNQSSLGFYITGETYIGSKGYSLKLDGMEEGWNDNMRTRAVVMHEAAYVSESWIEKYGRLGRSQGCPALPQEISKDVIDLIKDRTPIFAYYADPAYLKKSSYLELNKILEVQPPISRPLTE